MATEYPPLGKPFIAEYRYGDRNFPVVHIKKDPRVDNYKAPEVGDPCPDSRFPNHTFIQTLPTNSDERVLWVYEKLDGPQISGKIIDRDGNVATLTRQPVASGSPVDQGFKVISSSINPENKAFGTKETITVDKFPVLRGIQIDSRYGVALEYTKELVDAETAVGGIDGLESVEIEPKDQWRSWKLTTKLSQLPEEQVWYGYRKESFPDVLTGLQIVGTENFQPVPTWRVAPDMPLKARYTRKFSLGPPPEPTSPVLSPRYWAEPFYFAIEYLRVSQSTSESTSSSNNNVTSTSTNTSTQTSTSSGTNTSTSSGTTSSTNSGTSSSTNSSTNSSTSSSTNSGTNSSTSSGTNASTSFSVSNGTSNSTSTSTSSSTNSSTSSGTNSSTTSSTNSGTTSSTNSSTTSSNQESTGEGTSSTTESNKGAPLTSDPTTNRTSSYTTTTVGSGTNSGTSSGTQSSTNSGTSSSTSSGTNSSTSSSTSHTTTNSTNVSENTVTSSTTSSGTNTSTSSGTNTSTSSSTNSGTSSGTSSSTSSGTSSSTNSSTSSGTSSGTTQSTSTGTSYSENQSDSINSTTSRGKSIFNLTLPKCLRNNIDVVLPSGGTFRIPATKQTDLNWGNYIEVARQSEHWKQGIWITEIIEVYLPSI